MTVKATIVEKETKSEFPVLMELSNGNVVVLFIAQKKGTVVSSVNESVIKLVNTPRRGQLIMTSSHGNRLMVK